jgi:hypothetical protein
MVGKRAPGAGRKPRGEFRGKTATLTTRITPKTRAALERASRNSGRSRPKRWSPALTLHYAEIAIAPADRIFARLVKRSCSSRSASNEQPKRIGPRTRLLVELSVMGLNF